MSEGYNGWSNYETWLVKLWMDNDAGSYHYWQERTQEIADASDDDDSTAREIADSLKEEHEQQAEELGIPTSGVFSDLMTAALGEVDWREIAESLISDYRADNPREAEDVESE